MSVAVKQYYIIQNEGEVTAHEAGKGTLLGRGRTEDEVHAAVEKGYPNAVYAPRGGTAMPQFSIPSSFPAHVQTPQPTAQKVFCQACGESNVADVNFCWKCGSALNRTAVPASRSYAPSYQQPMATTITASVFSTWLDRWLPEVLAACGIALLLVCLALPFKTWHIASSGVLAYTSSGYDALNINGLAAIWVIGLPAVFTVANIVRKMRGAQRSGFGGWWGFGYGAVGAWNIYRLIAIYLGLKFINTQTGARLPGYSNQAGAGIYFCVRCMILLVAAGIIEWRRRPS